jgi:hypothetical protein
MQLKKKLVLAPQSTLEANLARELGSKASAASPASADSLTGHAGFASVSSSGFASVSSSGFASVSSSGFASVSSSGFASVSSSGFASV